MSGRSKVPGSQGSWSSCHAEISCCASGEAGAASGGEDHKLCPKIFVDTQTSYRFSLCSDRHSVRGLVLTLPGGLLQEARAITSCVMTDAKQGTAVVSSSAGHTSTSLGVWRRGRRQKSLPPIYHVLGKQPTVVRFCTNVCLSGRGMGDCNISARCPGRSRKFLPDHETNT